MNVAIEQRSFKRVELAFPLSISVLLSDRVEEVNSLGISNISYSGVCFKTTRLKEINRDDILSIAVSIPHGAARVFPFSRFIGKARVVRIEENLLSEPGLSGERAIALEFSPETIRLKAIF